MTRVRKAVIPAAGLGTRFLPATKAQAKEMIPIIDKPAVQYIVEEAVAAGLDDVLFITGRSKRAIEDHFDRSPELEASLAASGKTAQLAEVVAIAELAHVHSVRQPEARGLGHAISFAEHHVGDEAFVVMLGDDLMTVAVKKGLSRYSARQMIEDGAREALKNLSKVSLYTPGQPTTITIEVETVDKVGQFRGRHGVEVIEPLKVQSKGHDWLTAWDQVWPQADV